ncbi:MAG: cytochrome c-type biogenesis protein CcmH [Bdellovibrionota bacterium]|nr:MAG: cytochrome c-type biogenesis protein CcmH [Pseudomonadota bacterium]
MKKFLVMFTLAFSPLLLAQTPAQTQTGEVPSLQPPANTPGSESVTLLDKKTKYNNNDPLFRDIAKEFRCPTCTGLSVLESDAGFSVQIKEQVQEQLNLGKNHDQIIEYFTERYGAWILREPPAKGVNVLAWAIPITLLCAGPILIWLLVWKRHVKSDTHGVRSAAAILLEMQDSLKRLKEREVR